AGNPPSDLERGRTLLTESRQAARLDGDDYTPSCHRPIAQASVLFPRARALWGATEAKATNPPAARGIRYFYAQGSSSFSRETYANAAAISTGGGRACVLQGIESQGNCDRDPRAAWDRENASGIRSAKIDPRDQTAASHNLTGDDNTLMQEAIKGNRRPV